MPIDPTYTADTEIRLMRIENALSDIWRMMRSVINTEQFNRLNVINQQNLDRIDTRVDTAETDLRTLEGQYDDLL